MDRRLTPANDRIAAAELRGRVEAPAYSAGEIRSVATALTSIWSDRDMRRRDRQLLHGEEFRVLEVSGDVAFGQACRDGYVGYVDVRDLRQPIEANYIVAVPATHLYPSPDIKTPELLALSFGSRLRVVSTTGAFFETNDGDFVPRVHLRPLSAPFEDPATVAQLHFGTPYLWGGNSVWGIDCSGLVQAALLASGWDCPGDSDLQLAQVGSPLDDDAPLVRGDLVFWKGHVGMMVDAQVMIHANAHHMAVAYEPLDQAIRRIEAQGDGAPIGRRRP